MKPTKKLQPIKQIKLSLLLTLFSILAVFVMSSTAWATTYYVDTTNGNDSNNGTSQATAWKTIAKVNASSFHPADSILFKRGEVWREQLTVPSSGSEGSPITFGAYGGGDLPIISGADLITSSWTLHDTKVWKTILTTRPHIVLFDGEIGEHQGSIEEITSAGGWYWVGNVLYVYDEDEPSGVEVGIRNGCVSAYNKSYFTIQNIRITGWNGNINQGVYFVDVSHGILDTCIIEKGFGNATRLVNVTDCEITNNTITSGVPSIWDYHGAAIYATSGNQSTGCTISGNTISGFTNSGIWLYGENAANRSSGHTVTNNNSSGNGCGLYLLYTDGTNVSGNTFSDNTLDLYEEIEKYGIGVYASSGNVFSGNLISGNGISGIEICGDVDAESDNNIVRYNRITKNGLYGLMLSGLDADALKFYGNIVDANALSGIWCGGGVENSSEVYNNTFYGNGTYEIELRGTHPWTIRNNIAFSTKVDGYALYDRWGDAALAAHTNNLYYRVSGNVIKYNDVTYTLAELTNFEATAVGADPLFASPSTGDFTLQTGSPCINAGTDLGLTIDYQGLSVPMGSAPDIGAYEYQPLSALQPPKGLRIMMIQSSAGAND